MVQFFYLVSYLVSVLGIYHRSVLLTGKSSWSGLSVSALGYILFGSYLQWRFHYPPFALVAMVVMLFAAAIFVFLMDKHYATADRRARFEDFDKEQTEIESSVFSKLDPDVSWSAPERSRMRAVRKQYKVTVSPGYYVLIGGIILFNVAVGTYCSINKPESKPAPIRAPLITATELEHNQNKLVMCELYSDQKSTNPLKKIAFERLYIEDKTPGGDNIEFKDSKQSPEYLTLYSADRKIQVWVNGDDVDRTFLTQFFSDIGKQRKSAPVPKDWYASMANDQQKYIVKGLPTSQRLTCIGLVYQDDNALWLRPFNFKGREHGVIASPMTIEAMTAYLKAHPISAADKTSSKSEDDDDE